MTFTRFGAKILCLFLLMSLVPLTIAGVVVYKHVYDRTRDGVLRQLRSTAQHLNKQLDLLLTQRRIRVEDFSSDGFIRDCVEQLSLTTPEYSSISDKLNFHLRNNKKSLDPKIHDIEILNTRGVIIASTYPEQIGKDESDKNYFKIPFLSLEQKGSYFANDLERKGNTDELRLVFSIILKDKVLQSPMGVMATTVNGDIINDIFNQHMFHADEESDLGPFGEIYIVNSNKIMIANSTSSSTIDFKQIINTTPVPEVFLSQNEWSGVYKNYNGVQVLGAALFVSETNWVILAEIDVNEAFLPLTRIKHIFAISGLGVLLMVIIFAFLISNNISNIIRQFVTGLKRVANGNFDRRIEVGRRRDEIQTLAKSFNFMTDRLKESKELEHKFDKVKMLGSLTEKVNKGLTLEEVLSYVYEHFKSIIPYNRIGFALLVDDGTSVQAHWARSEAKDVYLTKGFSVKLKESSLSDVIENEKPRIINDMRKYLKINPQSESTSLMVKEGMLSSLNCPLFALGKPIGFVFFSSFKVNAYSNAHVELFMQIARELALTVEKSRLYQELENKFNEIKVLDSLTKKINAGLTLEDVLNHVFESFRAIIPYDRIGVAFLVDNGKTVEHSWTRTDAKEIKLENGYSVKLEETSLNIIVKKGKARIIQNMKEYLRVQPQSESTKLMVEEGMLSSLTCPLIALGKPIGFMFFSSFEVNAYSDVHVELFMQIAGELAVTVEKSRLYQELVELNELKNGFLGMAAHDLRNPNVLIRLYLNQLVEALGDINENQNVWITKIQKTSNSMMALINDFLDISIVEADKLQLDVKPVKFNALLKSNYKDNKFITEEKSITLKLDIEKELPIVDVDSDRINQVINNLITNAMKYSVTNTEIILSARVIDKEAVVSVIDQGQGIHQDDLNKLFKMFGKARGRPTAGEKATGLGLVICKHIVDAHGGRIWVESEGIGKGSTFKFTLPLKSKTEQQEERASALSSL
jgi:signal transduction histidine kinase/HAMP domain-containing protein